MANRAYLLATNDKSLTWPKDPANEMIAEGMNEIPVFCASLFVTEDRVIDTARGSKRLVVNWAVDSGTAKHRIKVLTPVMSNLLDRSSRQLWSWWREVINSERAKFFRTNAIEIFALDPSGYAKYWSTLLRAFKHPSPRTMKAAVALNGLSYANKRIAWAGLEETLCKLAGAEHIRKLPWFQRELPPPDDANGPRTVYDDIYEAMSPDDSLEEAMRKADEIFKSRKAKKKRNG